MIIQENTIIHGDSLTVLRQMEPESVDAIITDPPYGINYVSQTGASIKNDKSPFIWFLYDAFRVLKSGEAGHGGLICFTRWDVEQTFIDAMKIAGFNVKSEVIWDKVYHGMGDTKAAFAPSHENIVFAIKGKYSFPGSRPKDLVTFPKINSSKMVHPTEKPVGLLAMLQATMGGAEAGTKYKAFLRSATKGGEALGLKFTDANNQLLSMPEILDILRGKFGETMDAAEKMELQKAFGDTEAVALIDLMYNKVGDLQDNIVNMYGSLGKGVSVTEQMASAIQETEPERFERLKQRIHNVTESIGNSLLPTVNDLMSKGEGVLTKVGSWIEKNQELVKVIMLIVLAVGGFLAVGGTLIALISGVGLVVTKTVSAFKILKGGFALARGALTPLISSVWSFTAALLANPVTWVVIGIVALIAALVLLYNKCEWFRNAVNSVINFFKETLTAVGSVAKSVFEGIGNVIGSVMDAAKATVSEKLSNIKTAYEEHGGGISGVAAAAMEAVKGWYTAGYTFIDNLTGGKLSEIRGKFSTAMSNIVQGISQKFTDARTAFSNGLNNIKNAVSGAVTWFFESGKRIVSTFANGIKSAFSSAVEAVKGGLQKIRNLLPFSDAKEGPLSTLTLSGQRTMTTYAHGLTLAGDAPAEAMNKSLQQVQGALDREPEKKIDLGGGKKDKDESSDEGGSGKGKQVIIHKLLVPVDLKKIKDLQQLLALLQEVEDYAAANEDGEPGDDEDAAPAPA